MEILSKFIVFHASKSTIINSVKQGTHIDAHNRCIANYLNGKLHGIYTTYYPRNKQIYYSRSKAKCNYSRGKFYGIFFTWYQNGKLELMGYITADNYSYTKYELDGTVSKSQQSNIVPARLFGDIEACVLKRSTVVKFYDWYY